jgi:hypothetical protein
MTTPCGVSFETSGDALRMMKSMEPVQQGIEKTVPTLPALRTYDPGDADDCVARERGL